MEKVQMVSRRSASRKRRRLEVVTRGLGGLFVSGATWPVMSLRVDKARLTSCEVFIHYTWDKSLLSQLCGGNFEKYTDFNKTELGWYLHVRIRNEKIK